MLYFNGLVELRQVDYIRVWTGGYVFTRGVFSFARGLSYVVGQGFAVLVRNGDSIRTIFRRHVATNIGDHDGTRISARKGMASAIREYGLECH